MHFSTLHRAQPLSPNTLLRWDDDFQVPLVINFNTSSAATAVCMFLVTLGMLVFITAISVQIASALRTAPYFHQKSRTPVFPAVTGLDV